jgi:hypothetical protein
VRESGNGVVIVDTYCEQNGQRLIRKAEAHLAVE